MCTLAGLGLAGCAQRPQDVAVSHGKEYFPSSVYGPASKRVIADGQPVPRGGGQYLVGKPYTIAGRTYYPTESRTTQVGYASWYGDAFHGRLTANGEVYDRDAFTAASPTMPLPSYARVTNLRNNYSMIVRVNDRGPYASNRIMDVSKRVAEALDYKRYGTSLIKVEYVGRASLAGSDDARLYATLRTDGPASRHTERTMLAQTTSRTRLASASSSGFETRAYRQARIAEPETSDPSSRALSMNDSAQRIRRSKVATVVSSDSDGRERPSSRLLVRERDSAKYRNVARANMEEAYGPRHSFAHETWSTSGLRAPQRMAQSMPARWEQSGKDGRHTRDAVTPPSRPMDLGTIPGAATQIHAHREPATLRLARSRDD